MNDPLHCTHGHLQCVVTQVRRVEADYDGEVYVLVPEDLTDPDFVDVELACKDCGQTRLLTDSEWEVV